MRYIDADAICTYFKALAEQAEMEGLYNIAHIYKRCLQLVNDAPTADVVPRAELEHILSDLKKQIHDKAVYPETRSVKPYISLKVVDAIINNKMEEFRNEK